MPKYWHFQDMLICGMVDGIFETELPFKKANRVFQSPLRPKGRAGGLWPCH